MVLLCADIIAAGAENDTIPDTTLPRYSFLPLSLLLLFVCKQQKIQKQYHHTQQHSPRIIWTSLYHPTNYCNQYGFTCFVEHSLHLLFQSFLRSKLDLQ